MQLINSQTRLHQLIEALQQHIDHYGYQRLETQILQPADLFLTKAGDQLIQRLFTFDRFGRQFALRPEFTASAAKAYADLLRDGGDEQPVRWQFAGAVFEDAPDSAHVYQYYSVGAELIGWDSQIADVEILSLAVGGLRAVGCDAVKVTVGSVQFLRGLLASYDLDPRTLRFLTENIHHLNSQGKEFVLERFDRLAALGTSTAFESSSTNELELTVLLNGAESLAGRSREEILHRLQRKTQRAASRDQVVRALDQLEQLHAVGQDSGAPFSAIRGFLLPTQTDAHEALNDLERLISLASQCGVERTQVQFQPTLARDWNYYTGMVFELRTLSGDLLAGGGRYDELVRLIGGSDISAVGMAYYVDRILQKANFADAHIGSPVSIQITDGAAESALWWASQLRSAGLTVILKSTSDSSSLTSTSDGVLNFGSAVYSSDQLADVIELARTGRLADV